MKAKTISVLLLVLVAMLCLLTACDDKTTPEEEEETTHAHTYESVVTPPAKSTEGYTTHTCTVCGHSYTDSPVPATGYSVGLAYKVNSDGTTCTVTGIGTCRDREVVIPSAIDGYSVTAIGNEAFSGSQLQSCTIPNSVRSIGQDAFKDCKKLESITIPNGVQIIWNNAFSGCLKLKSVTIPDSVTHIGEGAFANCTSLTSIVIPDSVSTVGDFAFAFCKNLTSATISNLMTTIGQSMFWDCTSLTNVTIGSKVTCIAWSVFDGCSALTTVYYNGTATDWNSIDIREPNTELTSATRYDYSETEPTTEGNYWRYVDGVPTPWA